MNKIQGHIVKILDESSVVINLGSNKGVELGCKVEIINQIFEDIIDPINKESLGSLYTTKSLVVVSQVFDKMSICTTKSIYSQDSGVSNMASSFKGFFKSERETLNIDYNDLDSSDSLQDQPIKVGDMVNVYLKLPRPTKDDNS